MARGNAIKIPIQAASATHRDRKPLAATELFRTLLGEEEEQRIEWSKPKNVYIEKETEDDGKHPEKGIVDGGWRSNEMKVQEDEVVKDEKHEARPEWELELLAVRLVISA
jgi:hypothetical protein